MPASAALAGCSGTYVEHPVSRMVPPLQAGVYTPKTVDVRPFPTHEVQPDFPPDLGEILTGKATVVFTVGADGKVADASVIQADDGLFGDAALKAIGQWRFRPAEIKSVPVPCRMTQSFFFDSPYGIGSEGGPADMPSSPSPPDDSRSDSVVPQ